MFHPSSRPVRGVFALAVLLIASTLAACSSGGGSGESGEAKTPAEIAGDDAAVDGSGSSSDDDGDGDDSGGDTAGEPSGERTGSIEFLVPESADAPSGFRMIDTACESDDDLFGGHIVYAVPESWDVEGRGAAGTTITLDGDVDHRFGAADGIVTVAFARDNRDPENRILGDDGEASESFDHTIVDFDGEEKQVTHTEVLDTAVGDQAVTVWTTPTDDEALYKTRITAYHLTYPHDMEWTQSFVLTVSGAEGELSEAVVRTIIETVAIPDCTREATVIANEVAYSTDLDGDGQVAEPSDLVEIHG